MNKKYTCEKCGNKECTYDYCPNCGKLNAVIEQC
jgi:predicted RNA-binding Zn-ribbon protein involved in translation (DUF1610 family)